MRKINAIENEIMEVVRLAQSGEVDNSDLQGIAIAKAQDIVNRLDNEVDKKREVMFRNKRV